MKKLFTPNTVLAILMAVILLSFFVLNVMHFRNYLSVRDLPWWTDGYNLYNAIAINMLSAYVFYLLVIYLFAGRRKRIIKKNLQKQYRQFKESIIGHFLGAVNGSHSSEEVEQLYSLPAFRDYFKETDPTEGKDRWYVVLDRVQGDEYLQHELVVELAVLRDEVSYVLSAIEIHNEQMFNFFKRLQRIIYRHEHGQFETDDFESFMQFFYDVFSGWSHITGYSDKDYIQSFIDRL